MGAGATVRNRANELQAEGRAVAAALARSGGDSMRPVTELDRTEVGALMAALAVDATGADGALVGDATDPILSMPECAWPDGRARSSAT